MKRTIKLLMVPVCFLAGISGCAPKNSGFLITPVPVDQRLEESIIHEDPGWGGKDKIAIIDVDGLLFNNREKSLLGSNENPVSMFIEKVDFATSDPRVKAVVLRINSPGGGVAASDMMHSRLLRFRKEKKIPVIASIEDVGASGAYLLACGADKIISYPTSIVGSIGVIIQTVNFSGTMLKLGIQARAITSGKHKDMASPLKPFDESDVKILQGIVDEFYERFLSQVSASRKNIKKEKLRALADGRVFTGAMGVKNGLVDELGSVEDAIKIAKKSAGLKKVQVVIYHRPLGYRANAYSQTNIPTPQVNLLNISVEGISALKPPQFMYLWTGRR